MKQEYNIGVLGGGIAGLASAILLARRGLKVAVWEQKDFPRHKVCGEYISMESYEFLQSLGIKLDALKLPKITKLRLVGVEGTAVDSKLRVGGFGWSRYAFDKALFDVAVSNGVSVFTNEKVTQITNHKVITTKGEYTCDQILGAYGKMTPSFISNNKDKGYNYVGVKHHVEGNFDEEVITLYGFDGGYGGMSKIENNKFCFCYLVRSDKLREYGNSIEDVEKQVLGSNIELQSVLNQPKLWDKPLVISNIKFSGRSPKLDNMIQLGDAAGAISPLSGNGMSMALRSAYFLNQTFRGTSDELWQKTVADYSSQWEKTIGKKIRWAKHLNNLVVNPSSFQVVLQAMNAIPPLKRKLVDSLQGENII